MFLALELCLTAICAALAFIRPESGEGWFSALERHFAAFARKRSLAVVLVGLLALSLRLALLERRRQLLPRLEPLFNQWKAAHIPMSVLLTIIATIHIAIELRR